MATATSIPTTFGTAIKTGPLLTVTLITEALGTIFPGSGSLVRIVPATLSAKFSRVISRVNPRLANAAVASVTKVPRIGGTSTGAGPFETNTVIGVARFTDSPATGSVLTTLPIGIRSSKTSFVLAMIKVKSSKIDITSAGSRPAKSAGIKYRS